MGSYRVGDVTIPYRIFLSDAFKKEKKKVLKKDKSLKKEIDDTLKILMEKPYQESGRIINEKGLRKIRIGQSAWRIIFCIVDECKELGFDKFNDCSDYGRLDVIIRTLMPRKREYKRIR
ncbi:MAG: hypothetical protein ACXAB7_14720 [Candidatus Kariarchaeaceae archaeon]|jgi:mRNA-degrading endonuclease RelE of RelBE toxin-antitoxin system